ncbi:DNA replication complex GINS protein SLD5 [Fopius arisanus]|uniref:DNA replication complex GINS protein SLD5 n=1 Tax=Fopius arisanus TaxID=64838 RepID=A0A9R1U9Q2_9HYME|nr:PREDICTED: DNA replication complex GINS protein SLD5 [Fopius arisanus]
MEEGLGAVEDLSLTDTSDDGEERTAAELLTDMENAWINEKFAPEILPHKSNHVDCLLHHITYMDENLKRLPRGDLRLTIHKMEIDRIRYLISSYLRIRLEKIERNVIEILKSEGQRNAASRYLTDNELKYANEYAVNMETLFKSLVLQHVPQNFQELEVDKLSIKPQMNAHVFLRANRTIEGIIIPGTVDEELDFVQGSQHIIQYTAVADLVKNGSVQLI